MKKYNSRINVHLIINMVLFFNIIFCTSSQNDSLSFYDHSALDINGKLVAMDAFKGKNILVVNVASRCGYTPQYEGLQNLYEKYKESLVILGFPSNDFLWQEPGTNEDIKLFCKREYGVNFPMFDKIHVKGSAQHPIYQWLSDSNKNGWNDEAPKWNFNKYLLNPKGELINVFGSKIEPLDTMITNNFININLIK